MSDAVSPHGFTVTRRGYEISQVEQAIDDVTAERDSAWQQLSDVGEQVRGLEQELADAVRAAAEAEPPSFAELGEGAVRLLALAQEQASLLAADTARLAEQQMARARGEAAQLSTGIRDYAARLRAEADEAYRSGLEWARSQAEALNDEAGREARAAREAAGAEAAEIGARAGAESRDAQEWLAGQQRAADREQQEQEEWLQAWEQEVTAGAERKQGEGERHLKAVRALVADIDADAATQAARTVEAAHREAARIAAVAEREEAVLAERRGELQAHLDHIRQTLTVLTGAEPAAPEDEPDEVLPQAVDNAPAASSEES
jgi:cell division septum initiation protein DivIVA